MRLPWKKEDAGRYFFGFAIMFILAIATSIDAFAVGVTFAFFNINIFMAAAITGVITFCVSTIGVKIGNIFGEKLGTYRRIGSYYNRRKNLSRTYLFLTFRRN
ncbi:manganese efflux pump [Stenoxybacter acetivorans]|uniref:manganese efflux pump n=1 Tax=Stenoxybacter acetivorans TaxID=422441 RepID=UPI00068CFACF|nr:manganese efflux pump [Stenoxybacter acetivorans]